MDRPILILGGTTESRILASRLGLREGLRIQLSLAGRTAQPAQQPVPARHGGFGGPEGLAAYLRNERVGVLIDATHPYAAQISRNAAEAAAIAGVTRLMLIRRAWVPQPGDRWNRVGSTDAAVLALGQVRKRVFLTIGRQEADAFGAAAQHRYIVRSVDPIEPPLAAPDVDYLLARGPFAVEDEMALMTRHAIEIVVSKNSGGEATYAKIEAARRLGIDVVMIDRPAKPEGLHFETVASMVDAIDRLYDIARPSRS